MASDIVDISQTPSPTFTQWISLASDTFSLAGSILGVGIAYGFLESSAMVAAVAPPLAVALAVTGAVLALTNAIIALVNSNASIDAARTATQNLFNGFQADGYLHDWGVKIQFLAVYYDNMRDQTNGENKVTRWSPPDVAIFEDESAAWQTFLQATGTTSDRFLAALDKFRHVPQKVIDAAKHNFV